MKIFILLRAQTGHDFSLYKPSTINRRVERRMAVHQIEGIDGYVTYLQQTLLRWRHYFAICSSAARLTNFFRDPEAFRVLSDQVIPKLFVNKSPDAPIRVWITGCSTGEEAYSIAILLVERMGGDQSQLHGEIFANRH